MSQQNTHPFGDDNAVRIIPSPAGILQLAQLRKTSDIREGGHNDEISTQEYIRKITEEASEDDHFTRGPWLSAVQYLAAEGSITTGCFGNMKPLSKMENLKSIIHYKVLNDEVCGKAISVGAVLILRNVSVFSPKSFGHYLNITLKNIVKVFQKDTSAVNSGSSASTSRESYWAEEI
ncbi:transposase, MuDR, MULE transposase domain protein [Tanacetum coccineum]